MYCPLLLIGELIHKQGRIRQSNTASRQKVENQRRKEVLESIRKKFKDVEDSDKIDINTVHEYSTALIDKEILARIALLRRHSSAYMLILEVLNDLTVNMTNGVKFQTNEAKLTYQLGDFLLFSGTVYNHREHRETITLCVLCALCV